MIPAGNRPEGKRWQTRDMSRSRAAACGTGAWAAVTRCPFCSCTAAPARRTTTCSRWPSGSRSTGRRSSTTSSGAAARTRPDDTSLWTVDRFVTEVDQVRAALGLDRCHLLGQSWGGWLAIDYMARGPAGIAGLVLASTSASIAQFVAGARRPDRGAARAAPHGADRARRARRVRPSRLPRGRAGVLPPPPVPARPVARCAACGARPRWRGTRSTRR